MGFDGVGTAAVGFGAGLGFGGASSFSLVAGLGLLATLPLPVSMEVLEEALCTMLAIAEPPWDLESFANEPVAESFPDLELAVLGSGVGGAWVAGFNLTLNITKKLIEIHALSTYFTSICLMTTSAMFLLSSSWLSPISVVAESLTSIMYSFPSLATTASKLKPQNMIKIVNELNSNYCPPANVQTAKYFRDPINPGLVLV